MKNSDSSNSSHSSYPQREEEILEFWRRERIFEQTLARDAPRGHFVFWEGPPTANGLPGIHHVLARTFKDIIPRFKTMRGFRVLRKAGWDTHGLPVELAVEKELKISGKKQIENLVPGDAGASIALFNRHCKASVWSYQKEWEKLTDRIGFWLDLNRPYVTYENDYIEVLWWILSRAEARGLLTQGHKSVPYCPRCGTTLSSHEVAQGYDETDDPSIYVLFRWSTVNGQLSDAAFLVWTTTPWTLPGNVALAVDPGELYVEIAIRNTQYAIRNVLLAKKRLEVLKEDYQILREFPGSELVGQSYEPLYRQTDDPQAYQVVAADFVSMKEGTGIVHIAPAFGPEDLELGQKLGLPLLKTVDEAGLMTAAGSPGVGQFIKAADGEIIADLEKRGRLFRSERITHTYPFCWRCQTPLLYLARDSWYLAMSRLRDDLLARNAQINWIPGHIREGRFGEWLREIKDWAISRERYWGTPLPIWLCQRCEQRRVPASSTEFADQIEHRNTFLFLRHGEAEKDLRSALDWDNSGSLTERGREQIRQVAATLKGRGITKIIASPVVRTHETAAIVGQALGMTVETDDRLREMDFGDFKGKPVSRWRAAMAAPESRWLDGAPDGETWYAVQRRMTDAIAEFNSRLRGETILIVSHGDPLYVLFLRLAGVTELVGPESAVPYPVQAQVREAPVALFDLHRPFVDELTLTCDCGGTMRRVPEVCDVWFDSGAMPFAQWGWRGTGPIGPISRIGPIDTAAAQPQQYPAHYIAEAIDQTRGWFYTMLAVATILEPDLPHSVRSLPPYRTVISLGLLLDERGQKMSKSKGNVIDPWTVINQSGADALRLRLVTMNQAGDPKRFGVAGVADTLRRSFLLLDNVYRYYATYQSEVRSQKSEVRSQHVLDRWLKTRLAQVTAAVTEALERFDLNMAGRTLLAFIDELSTWYLRRSRGRTDPAFFVTLERALREMALLLAPFTPMYAEDLWLRVRRESDEPSVHLASWPTAAPPAAQDQQLLGIMDRVRQLVELGHADRNKHGLKLRQPLAQVTLVGIKELPTELAAILKEELNVKEIAYEAGETLGARIDPTLTPELEREGLERELARQIQNLRKEAKLQVGQPATLEWSSADELLASILSSPELAARLPQTTLRKTDQARDGARRITIGRRPATLFILNPKS